MLRAPFPYFGGKSQIAPDVWARLGAVTHYIEPFCGSAAMLLAAPKPAPLEVVSDTNGFIANFWRAVKHQPDAAAEWADYPVSHVDLGARHQWLMGQVDRVAGELQDPDWPGDAKVAGWWVWGQCCWIGSGWCSVAVPAVSNPGRGIQASGQVPHVSNPGRGIQASGQVPHVSDAGMGIQASGKIPHVSNAGMGIAGMLTSSGRTALVWFRRLAERLERVRVCHGDWSRCLNLHYGGTLSGVFLDPPYEATDGVYGDHGGHVHAEVEAWCRDHEDTRIVLCGHAGTYDLPGWEQVAWSRGRHTYGSEKTTADEVLWCSPVCIAQGRLW